jgi:hypothetical protein
MNAKRWTEVLGMAMIGDAVLALVAPEGHCRLWEAGPPWWRNMIERFAENPNATRCAGAAELMLGLWISLRAEKSASLEP